MAAAGANFQAGVLNVVLLQIQVAITLPKRVAGICCLYFFALITSVGILYVCNLWILLRKIVIYLVGRNFHLHRLFCC